MKNSLAAGVRTCLRARALNHANLPMPHTESPVPPSGLLQLPSYSLSLTHVGTVRARGFESMRSRIAVARDLAPLEEITAVCVCLCLYFCLCVRAHACTGVCVCLCSVLFFLFLCIFSSFETHMHVASVVSYRCSVYSVLWQAYGCCFYQQYFSARFYCIFVCIVRYLYIHTYTYT